MLRIGFLVLAFFILHVSYSQVKWDTVNANYVWTSEPVFSHPVQEEYYVSQSKNIRYKSIAHVLAQKLLSKYFTRFDETYSSEALASLAGEILQSDVVLLGHPAEFIYDIQYGNYPDGGFGLQTVGTYTHCIIDVSQEKIIPKFHWSITY